MSHLPSAQELIALDEFLQSDRCPPDIHIYTSTKLPWVVLPPGAKAVPEFYDVAEVWPAESRERARAARRRLRDQAASPDPADPGS